MLGSCIFFALVRRILSKCLAVDSMVVGLLILALWRMGLYLRCAVSCCCRLQCCGVAHLGYVDGSLTALRSAATRNMARKDLMRALKAQVESSSCCRWLLLLERVALFVCAIAVCHTVCDVDPVDDTHRGVRARPNCRDSLGAICGRWYFAASHHCITSQHHATFSRVFSSHSSTVL